MDLPATYYGDIDKRNPVIVCFERDVKAFINSMKRVASSTSRDNLSYTKGIKTLVDLWRNYKHRLPSKLYQQSMLRIADFLAGLKMFRLALWQGYSLHLHHFSTVNITDITDMEHFMACFFPQGFDEDGDIFDMKVRAMLGCAQCIFEREKKHSAETHVLSQNGLSKLLQVLNFLRSMMQAFQTHEHLCMQLYNGTLHIYNICRYLMTMNYSGRALEYLLWASISLELSGPLRCAKYVPWISTLYCAVCQCYYDNQAAAQAEKFARRGFEKIMAFAEREKERGVPSTRETQKAYKEGSIKLVAMIFKWVVFETRRNPEIPAVAFKTKSNLKDIPHGPWPCTAVERLLSALFDSSAAQFLGILEALWDSSARPLQTTVPEEPEMQEVVLELVSAGISILYGAGSQKRSDRMFLRSLTSTSSLMELACTGENKIPIMSAVRFIKIVFQCNQPDVFSELARELQQVLSTMEGHLFRKAELELLLLETFNTLHVTASKKTFIMEADRHKASFTVSEDFIILVDTLQKSVCDSAREAQPDEDLVLDLVLFLWSKLKVMIKNQPKSPEYASNAEKAVWCLSMLCEVAFACDLATVDVMMAAQMIHSLAILLESAAEGVVPQEKQDDDMTPPVGKSCIELLQEVCTVVERGLKTLAKGVAALLSYDFPTTGGSASKQSFGRIPSAFSVTSPMSDEGNGDGDKKEKEEAETKSDADMNINVAQHIRTTSVSLLATDILLELDIIHHRASLKLLQLNAVAESDLLDRIKKNQVSKAHYLIQKALVVYNNMEENNSSKIRALLKEATALIEKAEAEEKKMCLSSRARAASEKKDKAKIEDKETPPPPPLLLSRTDHSFIFTPAPYHMEAQVCWYQLCGCVAEGINLKVRLGDCSLPGTGNLVPARRNACLLKVDGLETNKKYVFAVAAYDSQGILLGKAIGETTCPLLASTPPPLLSTWAHLAQVAFQTDQHAIAKRACRELWDHYTTSDIGSHSTQHRLAATGLHMQAIQCSTPQLCQLFLTSIFIETAINIQQESLHCDPDTASAFFIWEQEARLAECERMLVATDLALWLDDRSAAVHAVVCCYGLLAPLIFHQSPCIPLVQVLTKCLIILEENAGILRYKWNVNTRKSIVHMIACMTYYLSGSLHSFKEHQKAAAVMDCGRTVLQEACDAPLLFSRFVAKAHSTKIVDPSKDTTNSGLLLRALRGKNKRPYVMYKDSVYSYQQPEEESATLHERITNGTLKEAYQSVMRLKQKARFIEFGPPLLQKALREGRPDLALKWGRTVFKYLSRSDRVLAQSTKKGSAKQSSAVSTLPVDPIPPSSSTQEDTRKKSKLKTAQRVRMNKEVQAVRKLLTLLSMLIQRRKKMLLLRSVCTEERVWKSHLNFSTAQAHVTLFYRGFEELHGADLQYSYRQMDLQSFSLAYSGMLVQQKNWQPPQFPQREKISCQSSLQEDIASVNDDKSEVDSALDDGRESCGDEDDSGQFAERHSEKDRNTSKLLLDSLTKASLHFQRAMVLAHRGRHWTTLQNICQTVWEQSCRISTLGQMGRQLRPPSLVTAEQLSDVFTPLLATAIDLIMDMLNHLGMWSLYDDMPEEEIESGLHFSAKMDDSTQVDMHWVRNLVMHTLEQLHDCGKWESLAHFAIYFNTFTRERYAWIVTPLLILAQRKLIERIGAHGGPAIPQPHYMKTQMATGVEVTCRDYKDSQLLSGWIVNLRDAPEARFRPPDLNELRESEKLRSLALVRIPLDIEDTMRCYRQALEKRPHYLQVLQHGRSLLLLLLAHTQSSFGSTMEQRQSKRLSRSTSAVDFCPIVTSTPNVEPSDLTEEDYNTPNSFYSLPIGPGHIPTIIAAFSSAIRYLKVNRQESLRILMLHEMGNLQFYSGNKRAAHLYWSRAIGNALQCQDVLEKWDGVSFGDGTLQQTLKHTGIWGCLQAAVLTAKIAQYLITSDISQRTRICLLSAHLFKCVLCCSLAQPQSDLEYASHSVGDELLPGVDLFSELYRAHIDATIGSLNFICQWLFCAGYHIKVLPILALYLHFVGTVCRDVQRTVEGKILKIHALTQLCLYTDAMKEVVLLTQGAGVLLPTGYNVCKGILQPIQTFCSNKSLLDNTEALDELVNCDFAPELCILCGPTLLLRFELARVELVLALSSTIHGPPLPDCVEEEKSGGETSGTETSGRNEQPGVGAWGTSRKTEHPKVMSLDLMKETLTPERIKFHLLEGAAYLLHSFSQKFTSQSHNEIESLELELESNLLKVDLYLQQRHALLSSEVAISSMVLLQASQVILRGSVSEKPASDQDTEDYCLPYPPNGECPRAVEASERIGAILWLRCCVALVRSLAAQIFDPVVQLPGKNVAEEAARVLKQGLDVCVRLGDVDTRALLMYEGAKIEAQRGKTGDSIALLQGAVRLLQGRTYLPSGSNVILAQATLLLSKLKGPEGTKLLKLTQKLVQKQLCVFGQNVVVDDGKICVSPSASNNIYLPYFQILFQTTS